MINILVTKRHTYTIAPPPGWPTHPSIDVVRPLTYESLPHRHELRPGCYIFSDIDRLKGGSLELACRLHQTLKPDPRYLVLNDPSKSLIRLSLLRTLEESGTNPFRARPLQKCHELRYPLFIREANEHSGPKTPLLHSGNEVGEATKRLLRKGFKTGELIAVEYVDTSDEQGRFRKYSIARVGDRMIARHIFFSSTWDMKSEVLITDETIEEELTYIHSNPHREMIKPIFDLAAIEYGRIDYAMLDGRPVIWEINTNPMLGTAPRQIGEGHLEREPVRSFTDAAVNEAFLELDSMVASDGGPIDFHVPRSLGLRIAAEDKFQDADRKRRDLTARVNWKLRRTR